MYQLKLRTWQGSTQIQVELIDKLYHIFNQHIDYIKTLTVRIQNLYWFSIEWFRLSTYLQTLTTYSQTGHVFVKLTSFQVFYCFVVSPTWVMYIADLSLTRRFRSQVSDLDWCNANRMQLKLKFQIRINVLLVLSSKMVKIKCLVKENERKKNEKKGLPTSQLSILLNFRRILYFKIILQLAFFIIFFQL